MNYSCPWGREVVDLQLSGCLVSISGLSIKQHRTILKNYESFVVHTNGGVNQADAICRAQRLPRLEDLYPEYYGVDGQYTLRKRRLGAWIEVTGLHFVARLDFSRPALVETELLVAEEEDISQLGILENFLRILMAYQAVLRGGVLLHSMGGVHQERAYLFTGRSGAGKTTLARKAAAEGMRVLSDDINLVIPDNGRFQAHKVPFTGEFGRHAENLSGCGSFPLAGLVLLEKTPTLTAIPVRPAETVAGLLTGCPFVNDDPEAFPALLEVLAKLAADVPVIRLGVSRDDSFEMVMTQFLRSCENA